MVAELVLIDYVILALSVLFGATFGSFFNVVIYRLPRGKNIAYPPSSCPKCSRPIRMRHNIPVIGWLLLRGKCYDCEAPISARYPFVEALSGLTFGFITWLEPLQMGLNLPGPPAGMSELLPTVVDLWWLAGLHVILLSGLLIAAGIDYDGLRVPTVVAVLLTMVAIGAIFAHPALLPVPAFAEFVRRWPLSPIAISGASSIYGAVVGMVFGCVISPGTGAGRSGDAGRYNGMIVLTWVGAVLGAQAVGTIAAVCALLYQFAMMYRFGITRLQHVTFAGLVWLATLAWIVLWKPIAGNPWFPLDSRATWQVLVWQATIATVAGAVTYWFRGPQHLAAQPPSSES